MTIARLDSTNPTADAWSSPLSLGADTLFQVHSGSAFIAYGPGAPASDDDGVLLTVEHGTNGRDSIVVPSGTTVRWRRAVPKKTTVLWYGAEGL
jgi:hypothetical protein